MISDNTKIGTGLLAGVSGRVLCFGKTWLGIIVVLSKDQGLATHARNIISQNILLLRESRCSFWDAFFCSIPPFWHSGIFSF